jgi:HTH-type transcriptional regulator/antitoxin HigA
MKIMTISTPGVFSMEIRPIKTEEDYEWALKEVEKLWGAPEGSPEEDRLDVLATLVSAYEEKHYPMAPPDPIDAIKFRMEQMGLTRTDLVPLFGSRHKVSEVLNRRRRLSMSMIRKVHLELRVPPEILIQETPLHVPRSSRRAATAPPRLRLEDHRPKRKVGSLHSRKKAAPVKR